MFERYTEKARRVIFFACYEASQLGSPYIETEHLLLGHLLREDKALTNRVDHSYVTETIPKPSHLAGQRCHHIHARWLGHPGRRRILGTHTGSSITRGG